ncbi:type II secretion system protein [Marinobacter sp. NFXS9]|uniref:type II secretion system protein n=1 Tax=Marinobacter sp. NFXS9 TaxID=2818433 RepID=UPI0032DF06C7
MRRAGGFALLEALVALVIVASVGAALFALINTGVQNLAKAEASVATTTLEPQVLSWVRGIDLSQLPETKQADIEFQSESGSVSARAFFKRVAGPTFTVTGSGARGIHQVALYRVDIELWHGQRRLDEIVTRRVASKQVLDEPTF